jgi:hypothetical protein
MALASKKRIRPKGKPEVSHHGLHAWRHNAKSPPGGKLVP